MKKFFERVWRWFDGKKLWGTISAFLGFQLAQLQAMYPDCLPIPESIPLIGGWCVPWSWLLPLLLASGITVGGGHKVVKHVKKNGALFMLLALLILAPIVVAKPQVHYYIGERINVLEGKKPGLTRELITKAAAAGCDGIVGLDQWSKNGDPRTDAKWRDSMHVMAQLCESLGLELRPMVWNGSKYAYGFPTGLETLTPENYSRVFWRAYQIPVGGRELLMFSLPPEYSHRLYALNVEVDGSPCKVRFFRDTPGQQTVSKTVAQPGSQSIVFHSLENSTPWFIYLAPNGTEPTRIFVRGLSERAPTLEEAPGYLSANDSYRYIGVDGPSAFFYSQSMNPDCTAALYRVAMRQSLLYWQEFQNEPAIKGVWFSLDEVAVCSDGQAYADMVERAAWFNYSLWGAEAWGWNDCLGGHNSTSMGAGTRATYNMQNTGPSADAPFLGFAWNEDKPGVFRSELARFDTGSVGAAVYLGSNNIDSAAVAIRDYECPAVILFNWQYQTWVDSLAWIVPKIKGD